VAGLKERYERIVLVAWSMGVWAAGRAFADHDDLFDRAVAVNGTARPIDAQYGIDPDMYRATLDGFSATTRDTFYRRMCHTPERLDRFMAAPPSRSIESQAAELESIMVQTKGGEPAAICPFDRVIVGKQDRIMRHGNQVRFWSDRAPCRVLNAPHYPFFDVTWEELLHDDTDGR
jgi:biotin synthesis protein BioG